MLIELILDAEKAQEAGLTILVKPRATEEQINLQVQRWAQTGVFGKLVDAQLAWMKGSDILGRIPKYKWYFDLGMYTHNSELILLFVRADNKSKLFRAIVDFATDADIGYDEWSDSTGEL